MYPRRSSILIIVDLKKSQVVLAIVTVLRINKRFIIRNKKEFAASVIDEHVEHVVFGRVRASTLKQSVVGGD